LADLCNVSEADIVRVEAGKEGLIGEVQDCLTRRGENVSEFASAHYQPLCECLGIDPNSVRSLSP
jgi:hypothetical protein